MKSTIPNPFSNHQEISFNDDSLKGKILVESGYTALRLLLRELNLQKGFKVAVPAFVCSLVHKAILKEGGQIIFLDLENSQTYWSQYSEKGIKDADVVILVHLYGTLHPDTEKIVENCAINKKPLLHDCAQAYFVEEKKLYPNNGFFYSFNVGKMCTAAGGALIYNRIGNTSINNNPIHRFFANWKAKTLLKSRLYSNSKNYDFQNKLHDFIRSRFIKYNLINPSHLYRATDLQRKAIESSIAVVKNNNKRRKLNWELLSKSILSNSNYTLLNKIPGDYPYKVIFSVNKGEKDFVNLMESKQVPYFNLFNVPQHINNCENFNNTAHQIFEISCEHTIPEEDINIINQLLLSFSTR